MISVVFRLHELLRSSNMPFSIIIPTIIVVGNQGVGKSSVLENFLGSDLIPKCSDIVTRRPLIIQLIPSHSEYVEFRNCSNKFTDFAQIRRKIIADTNRISGKNKGISKTPLRLKIYSNNVLPMTLIDLPGMTKVSVGNQSYKIESKIRKIITKYIKEENNIILAVTDANSDITNSDAIKLSRKFDPLGLRTINVITKLDMIDRDTGAMELLANCLIQTCPGYIGVVNRNQKEIDDKKDLQLALNSERDFFANNDTYKNMVDRMGSEYLQAVINEKILNHIIHCLPGLKRQIEAHMTATGSDCVDIMTTVNALEAELLKMVDGMRRCDKLDSDNIHQNKNISIDSVQDRCIVRREKARKRRRRMADRAAKKVECFNKHHAKMPYEMVEPYAGHWSKQSGFYRSIRSIVKERRQEGTEKKVEIWQLSKSEMPAIVSAIVREENAAVIYASDCQFVLPPMSVDGHDWLVHVAGGRVQVVLVEGVEARQVMDVTRGHSVSFYGGGLETVWVRMMDHHTTVLMESCRRQPVAVPGQRKRRSTVAPVSPGKRAATRAVELAKKRLRRC